MGITPDRTPGPSLEEELQLEDRTSDGDPTVEGAIRYLNGDFRGLTPTGIKSLTTGSGMSEGEHEALDTLVHWINETCYEEIARSGDKIDSAIYYTDSGKTTKIREVLITRSGGKISVVTMKQYDGSGTLAQTLTGTFSRDVNGKIETIDWVKS